MFLSTKSLLYILFPENISLFPLISWFVLYLILQAFTSQNATDYLSAEVQSVYSTVPADWARKIKSNSLDIVFKNYKSTIYFLNDISELTDNNTSILEYNSILRIGNLKNVAS